MRKTIKKSLALVTLFIMCLSVTHTTAQTVSKEFKHELKKRMVF